MLWEFVSEMLSEPAASERAGERADEPGQQHASTHQQPAAANHAATPAPCGGDGEGCGREGGVHGPDAPAAAAAGQTHGSAEGAGAERWEDAARHAQLAERRRRLTLGFYWTWAKRIVLARIVMGLLSSR